MKIQNLNLCTASPAPSIYLIAFPISLLFFMITKSDIQYCYHIQIDTNPRKYFQVYIQWSVGMRHYLFSVLIYAHNLTIYQILIGLEMLHSILYQSEFSTHYLLVIERLICCAHKSSQKLHIIHIGNKDIFSDLMGRQKCHSLKKVINVKEIRCAL